MVNVCQTGQPSYNSVKYVNGLKQRLFIAGKTAKLELKESQKKTKSVFDQKPSQQQLSPGDQDMFLLPVVGSQYFWSGHGLTKTFLVGLFGFFSIRGNKVVPHQFLKAIFTQ